MTGSGENQSRTSHNYWRHIFSSSQVANHSSNQENCFCCARKQTTPLDMTSVLPAGASRNVWHVTNHQIGHLISSYLLLAKTKLLLSYVKGKIPFWIKICYCY